MSQAGIWKENGARTHSRTGVVRRRRCGTVVGSASMMGMRSCSGMARVTTCGVRVRVTRRLSMGMAGSSYVMCGGRSFGMMVVVVMLASNRSLVVDEGKKDQ